MAVHITGTMGLPSGAVYPNCEMYFERKVGVVSQEGYAVVPEKTIVKSNASAAVDFYLLYGEYIGTIQTTLGVVKFAFSVLDVASATFTSCIGDVSAPIPADSVQVALDAAAAALVSATQAALYDGPWIDTLADFATNTNITYTAGAGQVVVGDYVQTRAESLSLIVLASGAGTYTHINANGVKANLVSRAYNVPSSLADAFTSAKYDVVAGVIRQNPADRTKWEFLNDSAHAPVGFDPDPAMLDSLGNPIYPTAAGGSLLLFFKHTTDLRRINGADLGYYDRVVGVNAWTDETLAKDWGIQVGAKTTRSGMLIYGSMHKTRHGRVYYSGSTWVCDEDSTHPTDAVTATWDSGLGVLTVTHGWLPGQNLRLDVDFRSTSGDEDGLVSTPFIPVRGRIISDTQFTVRFLQEGGAGPGFGSRVGSAGTGMSFRWTKSYDGPVRFDGTLGWDIIPWDTGDTGNIWIGGTMRREAPV